MGCTYCRMCAAQKRFHFDYLTRNWSMITCNTHTYTLIHALYMLVYTSCISSIAKVGSWSCVADDERVAVSTIKRIASIHLAKRKARGVASIERCARNYHRNETYRFVWYMCAVCWVSWVCVCVGQVVQLYTRYDRPRARKATIAIRRRDFLHHNKQQTSTT